jgi:hypothetical protein
LPLTRKYGNISHRTCVPVRKGGGEILLDNNDIFQIKNLMLETLEPFFIKIHNRLDNHDRKFDRIETDVAELKDDVKVLKTDVAVLCAG